MPTDVRKPLGDSDEVAEYLNVPKRTLDDWAHRGIGPRYSRVGRHRRYRWADVEAWLDEQANGGTAA
ncbi:helix-turn-helix transcriptional regulator [Actinomadura sp. 9N215]|uniref:helix-turn-helix transcriptional regulator n=1 Tax=Actinomadura sp. 9N215 TaxID=3375150 RepID=UPI0037BD6AA4